MAAKLIEFYRPAKKPPVVLKEIDDTTPPINTFQEALKGINNISDVLILMRYSDESLGLMSNMQSTPEILLFLEQFKYKVVSQSCVPDGIA